MSAELTGILGLVVLVLLLAARMWIGLAMALVGFYGPGNAQRHRQRPGGFGYRAL